MEALEYHPLANIFPLIEGEEFAELVASIAANGQREPIVLCGGKILDGRNRYRACVEAGLEPRFVDLPDGENELRYVIDHNLRRRHLTDDQRRMVAARLAKLGRGRPSEIYQDDNISRSDAAALLAVDIQGVDRAKKVVAKGVEELQKAVDDGELSVNAASQIARKSEDEQREELASRGIIPNGARAIMGSRREPDDSLDYFPTPPTATRALLTVVLPQLGILPRDLGTVWEPACGEGHITGVLEEYPISPIGTDIHDYSADGRMPPSWWKALDFLDEDSGDGIPVADWIITNPPFGNKAIEFVLRALREARAGVAMFFRTQWAVEGEERYERLFRDHPPTLFAPFVERVPLAKGRFDPDGSTATAYCWLVWVRGMEPRPVFWIPPGQRKALAKPSDRARFTAHPVMPAVDPDTGEIIESDGEGAAASPPPREGQDVAAGSETTAADDTLPSLPSEPDPQHGADTSVRDDVGSSLPVETAPYPRFGGQDTRTEAGAGNAVIPRADLPSGTAAPASTSPHIDIEIPRALRRVDMTESERSLVETIDIADPALTLNQRTLIAKLRKPGAAFTELDRDYLAKIAAKVEQVAA